MKRIIFTLAIVLVALSATIARPNDSYDYRVYGYQYFHTASFDTSTIFEQLGVQFYFEEPVKFLFSMKTTGSIMFYHFVYDETDGKRKLQKTTYKGEHVNLYSPDYTIHVRFLNVQPDHELYFANLTVQNEDLRDTVTITDTVVISDTIYKDTLTIKETLIDTITVFVDTCGTVTGTSVIDVSTTIALNPYVNGNTYEIGQVVDRIDMYDIGTGKIIKQDTSIDYMDISELNGAYVAVMYTQSKVYSHKFVIY